jgi:GntR family transcriptional regulator of arabinose operon
MAKTKHEIIFDEIRSHIVTGRWQSGDAIPTHHQMMSRYDAALGTVRQAVLRLQHEGLVCGERGRGMFVAERAGVATTDSGCATIGFLIVNSRTSTPM